MKIPEQGKLLRVFIGESDRWHQQPIYEAIVLKGRELGLAGATVLRGPMSLRPRTHSLEHDASNFGRERNPVPFKVRRSR